MAAAVADIRDKAQSLVRDAETKRQSRMLAYDEVGSLIGASGQWVRGFVKGYDNYRLSHIVALNIRAVYDRACSRVEANTESMRRERTYAAAESNMGEPLREDAPTSRFLPPLEL